MDKHRPTSNLQAISPWCLATKGIDTEERIFDTGIYCMVDFERVIGGGDGGDDPVQ